MTWIIETKLLPPRLMGRPLERKRVVAALRAAESGSLLAIIAPPGYGKTVLLQQYFLGRKADAKLTAWFSLDNYDASPEVFMAYVHRAIGIAVARRYAGKTHLFDDADGKATEGLARLFEAISGIPETVVLILDDFHRIENQAYAEFYKLFFTRKPDNLSIFVSSRHALPVWLADHFSRRSAALTVDQLKFEESELLSLLGRNVDLTKPYVRSFLEKAEGWPLALQYLNFKLKSSETQTRDLEVLPKLQGGLGEYLFASVFEDLDEVSKEVLINTSILPRFSDGLAVATCGHASSRGVLERLMLQNLFLINLEDNDEWYRYHHLFGDYLQKKFSKQNIHKQEHVLSKAARWFGDNGFLADAVLVAREKQDKSLLVELLEEAGGWKLLFTGGGVLRDVLNLLGDDLLASSPRLLLSKAYLSAQNGYHDDAAHYLALVRNGPAVKALTEENTPPSRKYTLIHEVSVVEQVVMEYRGDPFTAARIAELERLRDVVPVAQPLILAAVRESLATGYFEIGNYSAASNEFLEAQSAYQVGGSCYGEAFTNMHYARLLLGQGKLQDAKRIHESNETLIADHLGKETGIYAAHQVFWAELTYFMGDYLTAGTMLTASLPLVEQGDGWQEVFLSGYQTAVRSALAAGHKDEAERWLERGIQTANRRQLVELRECMKLLELEFARRTSNLPFDRIPQQAPVNDVGNGTFRRLSEAQKANEAIALAHSGQEDAALEACVDFLEAIAGENRVLKELEWKIIQAMVNSKLAPGLSSERWGLLLLEIQSVGLERLLLDKIDLIQRDLERFIKDCAKNLKWRRAVSFCRVVLTSFKTETAMLQNSSHGVLLDLRELEVLGYLSLGMTNKEIARELGLGPDGVKYWLKSLYKKFDVSSRQSAVKKARLFGLV